MKTMIKNKTPYLGKVKLKFQKHPHYIGKSLLNDVHLDLGFVKLVSRVFPEKDKKEWIPDINKIYKINIYTGGRIGNHTINHLGLEIPLKNVFISKDGTQIGNLMTGWWYYKNNLKVCDEYPKNLAIKYDNIHNTTFVNSNKNGMAKIVGYMVVNLGKNVLFSLGDSIYDETYISSPLDFTEKEWMRFEKEFQQKLDNTKSDLLWDRLRKVGIKSVIPPNRLGSKKITTIEEAKQSAINFLKKNYE